MINEMRIAAKTDLSRSINYLWRRLIAEKQEEMRVRAINKAGEKMLEILKSFKSNCENKAIRVEIDGE